MSRTKKHAESSNGKAEAAIASKYKWDDAESISSFSSSNFGITLKGKTVDKGKPVAMEFMPSSKENDEIADNVCKIRGHLQRLMEARQIPSDHIMLFSNYFYLEDHHVFVTKYAQGRSLNDWLAKRRAVSQLDKAYIILNLLKAIRALHVAGIMNLALSPKRVLFLKEANTYQGSEVGRDLVISNFRNAATFIKQQDESDDEAFRGDPTLHIEPGKWFEGEEYLAPEVTNEASSIQHGVIIMSPKVDIFAVGMIACDLCEIHPRVGGNTGPVTEYGLYLKGNDREKWKELTQEGKDLLKQLTQVDRRERANDKKAMHLANLWVASLSQPQSPSPTRRVTRHKRDSTASVKTHRAFHNFLL